MEFHMETTMASICSEVFICTILQPKFAEEEKITLGVHRDYLLKTSDRDISKRPRQIFLKLRISVVLVSIFKSCVALMAWTFFPC